MTGIDRFHCVAKAFDTVPHNRLRHKLQWYGIVGNTYQWISSFLSDRHQKVFVDVLFDSVPVVSAVAVVMVSAETPSERAHAPN